MTLEEKRTEWEKGLTSILRVVNVYKDTILIVLENIIYGGEKKKYYLHRYFKCGDGNWEISVDYDGDNLISAIGKVNYYFKDILLNLYS